MRKEQGIEIIDSFDGDFRFLSNFFPCNIRRGIDIVWHTSENAFQAAKALGTDHFKEFMAMTPGQSKREGKKLELRPDWEEVKIGVMYHIVLDKFSQNLELRLKLLETRNALIVEGNTWNDNFWGVHHEPEEELPLSVINASCLPCAENNHLGRILMIVRFHLSLTH